MLPFVWIRRLRLNGYSGNWRNISSHHGQRLVRRLSLFRLLEQDDEEGITYVTQFHCKGLEDCQRYLREFAPRLRQEAFDKWGDRFIAFRTVMESVH